MKKTIKWIKLIVVNVFVFVVLLELVAVVIYLINHKAFFYTHKQEVQPAAVPGSPVDRRITQLTLMGA